MTIITWRNVDKLSSDDMGKSFLDSAQQSINGSISGLGGIVKNFQATADANQQVAKENATYDFMQRIMAAKTAGEFGNNSPELMSALAANGPNLDRSKLLPFMDKRGAELQARDTATTTFNNAQEIEKQRPAVEAYRVLAQKGDKIGMAAFEAANPGIRNMSTLLGEARGIQDGIAKTDLDTRTAEQNIKASVSNAAAATSNAAATTLNANTNVKQLGLQEAEYKVKAFERAAAKAAEFETKAREVHAGTISSPEGRKAIDAEIETMLGKRAPDDKLRQTLRSNVNAAIADPANRGMLVTDFLAAIGSAKTGRTWVGNFFNNEGTYGDNIKGDLEKARVQPGYLSSLENREKLATSNMAKADQFKTMMQAYYPDLAEATSPTGGVPTSKPAPVAAVTPAVQALVSNLDTKTKPTAAELLDTGLATSKAEVKEILKAAPGKEVDKATRDAFYLNYALEKAKKEAEASAVPGSAAFGLPVKKQK
jgi:hypothetical protein